MGLLRPYEQRNAKTGQAGETEPVVVETDPTDEAGPRGPRRKDRPTPTRAEAEKARMERLHPNLTKKELKAAERRARQTARQDSWTAQQNTPEKVLMRDYVDARWTVTEFLLPTMLVLVAVSFAFARSATVQTVIMGVMLFLLISWVGNVWWAWRGYKAEAARRIKNPFFRGVLMEMNSRMMSIRRFRNPGPRIKRGESY